MRLLLDENLPHQLRHEVTGHECFTASYCGFEALANGKLLQAAAEAGFDAILSMDRGLEFQHDTQRLPLSIVLLHASNNKIVSIRPLIPALLEALKVVKPRTLVTVR